MTIKAELLALKRKNGMILAEDGVVWARKHPQSKLHKSLEWDDAKAGQEYRIWQVRRLIALYIVSASGQRQLVSLSIDRSKEGGYRSLDDVLPNSQLRDVLLEDALKELDRVQQKYDSLTELSAVWTAKEQVKVRVKKAA